ncbi:elongation factor Ts, mitochondrial [Nymphaea colorata]|nr:elongation factor Ts, mitochondrial [Nymphaea colorata]XP_049935288.1 elongation factor Ts, mitochondrial [Nymphaea colorata]
MACLKRTKDSIKYIFGTFGTLRKSRNNYSSWTHNIQQIAGVTEGHSSSPILHGRVHRGPCNLMLVRTFSVETSPSEQMNLIKQLRESTSAPIKDVKAALVDCSWDIDAAQKELRKRGVYLASKKSLRTAAEGLIALAQNDKTAAVIELNCETDFVARNDIFQYLALALAKKALSIESSHQALSSLPLNLESFEDMNIILDHPKLKGETTVQSAITEVAAMVGENVKFGRGLSLSVSSHGVVSSYLHTSPKPGLGRIAGLLTLEVENDAVQPDALHRVGSTLAMHIVAAKPLFLSKDMVSSEALESEKDILKSQAKSTGKSEIAVEKMVEGRLKKYLQDVVLLEQKFVMNDSVNVKSLLDDLSKEVGAQVTIGKFLRMEVGEATQRVEASSEAA